MKIRFVFFSRPFTVFSMLALLFVSAASPGALADCFSVSGKSGFIKNLNKPWVLTVFLDQSGKTPSQYRLKSFGVQLHGDFSCRAGFCRNDQGAIEVRKVADGLELRFPEALAVEKASDRDPLARAVASGDPTPAQLFKLESVHKDICHDAFFRKAAKADEITITPTVVETADPGAKDPLEP